MGEKNGVYIFPDLDTNLNIMPERIHHRFDDDQPISKCAPSLFSSSGDSASAIAGIKRKRETSRAIPGSSSNSSIRSNAHKDFSEQLSPSLPQTRDHTEQPISKISPIGNEGSHSTAVGPLNGKHLSKNRPVLLPGNREHSQVQRSLKEKALLLQATRKKLPIWPHAEEIRNGLRSKDVLLMVGETGSGKSTQVPQFLLSEPWCRSKRVDVVNAGTQTATMVGGCIAVTQPRRVAAITLAKRVAEEMGTPLGSSSPASKVGYSVRFDNSTSPSTKIKFLTEGMLLQEMLRDPWLRQYSAVIVDEVHERGINVDLVMGFLRTMLAGKNEGRGGISLKVAVMSATADLKGLVRFFADDLLNRQAPEINKHFENVQNDPAGHIGDDDTSEWSGISSENGQDSSLQPRVDNDQMSKELESIRYISDHAIEKSASAVGSNELLNVSTCHIKGRQYPVEEIYLSEPVQDYVDAALRTIFQIHYKEPLPGDILVFLTGQETVESLEKLVQDYSVGLGPEVPKILVLPLFAALPQAAQQKVFQPTPPKTRKIVLATNIAETSVTVSGVRFVIDPGKSKIKQFRTRLGLDSLLVKPISKSAATQRKGRAGREAPGQCYRLYTEQDYLSLPESNTPEILRCDLSQAILTMKARGVGDIMNFPFLDRPPREALEKALMQLLQLGALNESGEINDIGSRMAKLPLTAPLGRVLLAAAEPEMDCLDEVIDIISCLSVENIFLNLNSEETKEAAEVTRRALYRREGDHLTLLTTVQAYAAERSDRRAWAEKHFVSHRAMRAVMVRKDEPHSQVLAAKDDGPNAAYYSHPTFSDMVHK